MLIIPMNKLELLCSLSEKISTPYLEEIINYHLPDEVDMEEVKHTTINYKNGIGYCSLCGESLSVPIRKRCGECGAVLDRKDW